jgi:hypothetical protein
MISAYLKRQIDGGVIEEIQIFHGYWPEWDINLKSKRTYARTQK